MTVWTLPYKSDKTTFFITKRFFFKFSIPAWSITLRIAEEKEFICLHTFQFEGLNKVLWEKLKTRNAESIFTFINEVTQTNKDKNTKTKI